MGSLTLAVLGPTLGNLSLTLNGRGLGPARMPYPRGPFLAPSWTPEPGRTEATGSKEGPFWEAIQSNPSFSHDALFAAH